MKIMRQACPPRLSWTPALSSTSLLHETMVSAIASEYVLLSQVRWRYFGA